MNTPLDSCRGSVLADRADFFANAGRLYATDGVRGPLAVVVGSGPP